MDGKIPSFSRRLPLWNSKPVRRVEFQFLTERSRVIIFFFFCVKSLPPDGRQVVSIPSDPMLRPSSWCKRLSVIHQRGDSSNLSTPPPASSSSNQALLRAPRPLLLWQPLLCPGMRRGDRVWGDSIWHVHAHSRSHPPFSRGVIEALNPSVSFSVVVVRQNKSRQSRIGAQDGADENAREDAPTSATYLHAVTPGRYYINIFSTGSSHHLSFFSWVSLFHLCASAPHWGKWIKLGITSFVRMPVCACVIPELWLQSKRSRVNTISAVRAVEGQHAGAHTGCSQQSHAEEKGGSTGHKHGAKSMLLFGVKIVDKKWVDLSILSLGKNERPHLTPENRHPLKGLCSAVAWKQKNCYWTRTCFLRDNLQLPVAQGKGKNSEKSSWHVPTFRHPQVICSLTAMHESSHDG